MGAHLREANLGEADLRNANLSGVDLRGADLSGTDLRNANLSGSNLRGADLRAAILVGSIVNGVNLRDAKLSNIVLEDTVFGNVDLRNATGLDSCQHRGPSILNLRTLLRSAPLPIAFLRGCGLPDSIIDYIPSLLGTATAFSSCFISYSTADQEFAEQLHADLQNKGVRCWFAPNDIQGGKKIHEQIDEAIRLHDKLLLILSPSSMNSEWVKTEIAKARKRELRENRRMLFPLRLVNFETLRDWECFDGDTGKDSAREIREYFIPEFSNWKTDHDTYTKAFEQLLRDLKAEKEAAAGS